MKRLSGKKIRKKKAGLSKIELRLIWPLDYHPAGEIGLTSAIHTLNTLNHFATALALIWMVLDRAQGSKAEHRSLSAV